MDNQEIMRQQLLALLSGGHAHMSFDDAVADFPMDAINQEPPDVPYTPWHLLEHLRIAQWDILEFIRNPDHESPQWPEGYWPRRDEKTDQAGWEKTILGFRGNLKALQELVKDPGTDLLKPLPHAKSYNIVREILTVSDHNAYHIGEFAILRQIMGTWPAGHR